MEYQRERWEEKRKSRHPAYLVIEAFVTSKIKGLQRNLWVITPHVFII